MDWHKFERDAIRGAETQYLIQVEVFWVIPIKTFETVTF